MEDFKSLQYNNIRDTRVLERRTPVQALYRMVGCMFVELLIPKYLILLISKGLQNFRGNRMAIKHEGDVIVLHLL